MNQITIDSSLKDQFAGLVGPVEVVDERGCSLGRFVPMQAMIVSDDCPYSVEELSKMQSEKGGRTLAEIWKSLGAK